MKRAKVMINSHCKHLPYEVVEASERLRLERYPNLPKQRLESLSEASLLVFILAN